MPFLQDVFGITPWSGENDTPGQLEILLDMQQSICDQLDGKENVPYIFLGEAAYGVGKTFVLEAAVLLYFHECFPPASGETNLVLSTAPTSTQVNALLWKDVRKLIEMAAERGYRVGRGILPSEARINKSGTHFAVGRTTSDSGGKGAERSQGQHNEYQAVLFDEAEGIPDFFYNGVKRQFTGNRVRLWVLMANPKTRTSRFQRMKQQRGVKVYRLSLLNFPNVVHGRQIVPNGATRTVFEDWLFDLEDFGALPTDGTDIKQNQARYQAQDTAERAAVHQIAGGKHHTELSRVLPIGQVRWGVHTLKKTAAVLGLFMGGMVAGQAFGPTFIDGIRGQKLTNSARTADAIALSYREKLKEASGSTTEISQVANEATVQLLYLQTRQNAEIIQLLTDVKNKK